MLVCNQVLATTFYANLIRSREHYCLDTVMKLIVDVVELSATHSHPFKFVQYSTSHFSTNLRCGFLTWQNQCFIIVRIPEVISKIGLFLEVTAPTSCL